MNASMRRRTRLAAVVAGPLLLATAVATPAFAQTQDPPGAGEAWNVATAPAGDAQAGDAQAGDAQAGDAGADQQANAQDQAGGGKTAEVDEGFFTDLKQGLSDAVDAVNPFNADAQAGDAQAGDAGADQNADGQNGQNGQDKNADGQDKGDNGQDKGADANADAAAGALKVGDTVTVTPAGDPVEGTVTAVDGESVTITIAAGDAAAGDAAAGDAAGDAAAGDAAAGDAAAGDAAAGDAAAGDAALSTDAATVLTSTNEARTAANLPPLVEDPVLTALAQAHADDMADDTPFFDHVNAEGLDPAERGAAVGQEVRAEVFAQDTGSVADVTKELLAEPTNVSSTNINNPNYTRVGTGVATDANGVTSVVQVLARDAAPADPAAAPAQDATAPAEDASAPAEAPAQDPAAPAAPAQDAAPAAPGY